MASINISNISGSDLFNDSESFMVELSDDNELIIGGLKQVSDSCGLCTKGNTVLICTVTIKQQ